MSWRIEHANPLALLSELPDGLAHTCFLRPPRGLPAPRLLATLDQVRRVLRDDGTLWFSLPRHPSQPQALKALEHAGWLRPDRATHSSQGSLIAGYSPLTLLAKQQDFHRNPQLTLRDAAPRRAEEVCASSQRCRAISPRRLQRRAWCLPAGGSDGICEEVIDRCVRSSTSPQACAVCGTPWRWSPEAADRAGRWRPVCPHSNGRGHCLVLDLYCRSHADVGLATLRAGRSYLGATHDPDTAQQARARLDVMGREARR